MKPMYKLVEMLSVKELELSILPGLVSTESLIRPRKANNSMFSASLCELSYYMAQRAAATTTPKKTKNKSKNKKT